ncbi:hypothetical protein C0T31_06370 [Dysgonamonadaceae bacterium]|nr:hypothetical protein C0T31_06370 [Dysgonamonadaceae bacterium]
MAKKQTSTKILSPENYIRQRARNLPLYQCLINDGWNDHGIANIIVSREHINGNITACFYLVDLFCLGVKDTFFRFNISKWEYDGMIEKFTETMPMSVVEYNLVHNIIFAALEFAEEIGFNPHKDFESITQYMLEEDDEKIPLIDIACGGKNGKPHYIQGEMDSDAKARQILNHLDKKVGPNNYYYLLATELDEIDEDFDDEDTDDEEGGEDDFENNYSEYLSNSFEENAKLFIEFTNFLDKDELLNDDSFMPDATKLMALTDVLKKDIVNKDLVDEWLKKWQEESEKIQITDLFSRETLGLTPDQPFTEKDLNYLTNADEEKRLKYMRKKWGKIPLVVYHEIMLEENGDKRSKKIKEYFDKYPDFPLLKAEFLMEQFQNKMIVPDETWLEFSNLFPFRQTISYREFYELALLRFYYFIYEKNLEGFSSIMSSFDPYDEMPEDLLFLIQIFYLSGHLPLLRGAVLQKNHFERRLSE